MIEERKLLNLSMWFEPAEPFRGGKGNPVIGVFLPDRVIGEVEVSIVRKGATKLLGLDKDLSNTSKININQLPDDIKEDLADIWERIEKIL
jgi:hypothetical protein